MKRILFQYTLALVTAYAASWVAFGYMLEHAPADVQQTTYKAGE